MHTTVLVRESEAIPPVSAPRKKTSVLITEKPLRSALRKIGTSPFTDESVGAYKRDKVVELHQQYPLCALNRAVVRALAPFPEFVSWAEISLLFGTVGTWAIMLITALFRFSADGLPGIGYAFTMMGPWVLLCTTLFTYGLYISGRPVPFWTRVAEREMPRYLIPKQVQLTMRELRFHFPKVEFAFDKIDFMRVSDPFLVAITRNEDDSIAEEYVIEVWDQPDFAP